MVIRAKNEARFIGETLAALSPPAALAPRQVVVVDSGSTDGTSGHRAHVSHARLIQIRPEEFTYGYALNLGVANVDAEIVATLSAHSLPGRPGLAAAVDRAVQHSRSWPACTVANCPARTPPCSSCSACGSPASSARRPRLLDRRPLFSNANGAFRRSLWLEHPFDEEVGGAEDIAWVRTMQERGYLIAYQPDAAVYHSHGEPSCQTSATSQSRRADGRRQFPAPRLGWPTSRPNPPPAEARCSRRATGV